MFESPMSARDVAEKLKWYVDTTRMSLAAVAAEVGNNRSGATQGDILDALRLQQWPYAEALAALLPGAAYPQTLPGGGFSMPNHTPPDAVIQQLPPMPGYSYPPQAPVVLPPQPYPAPYQGSLFQGPVVPQPYPGQYQTNNPYQNPYGAGQAQFAAPPRPAPTSSMARVPMQNLRGLARQMGDAVAQYYQNPANAPTSPAEAVRSANTLGILEDIATGGASSEGEAVLYTDNRGRAVGIMTLRRMQRGSGDVLMVDHIVTFPGTQGAGRALIEEAVNTSAKMGMRGRQELDAYEGSETFYERLGFQNIEGSLKYSLSPGDGRGWWYDNQRWNLVSRDRPADFMPGSSRSGRSRPMLIEAEIRSKIQKTVFRVLKNYKLNDNFISSIMADLLKCVQGLSEQDARDTILSLLYRWLKVSSPDKRYIYEALIEAFTGN